MQERLSEEEAQRKPDRNSLVGSWFLGTADNGVQGCVVAEVSPGVYLIELMDWFVGASTHQELVYLHEMKEWRFYDSNKWMVDDYEHGVKFRWEAARRREEAADAAQD